MYIFVLSLLMTACEEKVENDVPAEITPSVGTWLVTEPVFTSNSCVESDDDSDAEEGDVEYQSMVLTLQDGGMYTVDVDGLSFNCTLAASTLSCEPQTLDEVSEDADAVLSESLTPTLSFSSETELAGTLSIELDCSGADCASLSELGFIIPCAAEGEFTGTFQE